MSDQVRAIDEILDLIALGLLDGDELAELQRRIGAASAAVAALGTSAPEVAPPAAARDRLLSAAAAEKPVPNPHTVVKRSDQWRDIGVPGIRMRRLFVAPDGLVTMVVQMDSGATHPGHRHGAWEETYVLEGDLTIGEHTFGPGDFHRCEEGSVHATQQTTDGCMVLLRTYMRDEMFDN